MAGKCVNEIFDLAIKKEEEAARFYTDLSAQTDNPVMKQVFLDFAAEEKCHKEKLAAIKAGQMPLPAEEQVLDLKIADYLDDVEPCTALDYAQALALAMKNEKAAFRLYTDLAGKVTHEPLKSTLLILAQEEAKHKLRFEVEYDEYLRQREN